MTAETTVDWVPALVVLAIGLILGAGLVWRFLVASRRAARAGASLPAVEVRDLAGKSEALLRQLRELEDTASKRTPEQLARERYALELEAAKALLALEERGMPAKLASMGAAAEPATPAGAARDRAGLRGFFWGIGSATGLLLLGLFVYQSAKPREPGASVTGNTPITSKPAGGEAATEEEARIQAALARNPEDLDGHLALARLYVERQQWMQVWNETAKVLERAPGNPRALAYQSMVRLAMGQVDVAVNLLTKALDSDPDLVDGYAYLALAYARTGRMPEAEAAIAKASRRFPERAADLRRYLTGLKGETPVAQAGAASGASGAADPHAGLATPGEGAPQRSGTTGRRVSGTVDVDPSLRSNLPPGGVLFVFARAAGVSEGPPVAVKRLPARFPAAFELSEADSMMGQPLPDRLLIEARLDEDGDPTTRSPTDPKARLDRVKVGRSDVQLILKRP
jgi:tetratricopeptide (TPR) repeat protein